MGYQLHLGLSTKSSLFSAPWSVVGVGTELNNTKDLSEGSCGNVLLQKLPYTW